MNEREGRPSGWWNLLTYVTATTVTTTLVPPPHTQAPMPSPNLLTVQHSHWLLPKETQPSTLPWPLPSPSPLPLTGTLVPDEDGSPPQTFRALDTVQLENE